MNVWLRCGRFGGIQRAAWVFSWLLVIITKLFTVGDFRFTLSFPKYDAKRFADFHEVRIWPTQLGLMLLEEGRT